MKKKSTAFGIIWAILCLATAMAFAGDLEPLAGPDNASSALYTIEDVYQRLDTGAAGVKRAGGFTEPAADPGATGHTLSEVMNLAPAMDEAKGATANDVISGKTFWGLTSGAWGPKTGSVSVYEGVPRTGQTTSHASPGDDGAFKKGVAWPDPRFSDNGDGTVTDNLTGLVWLKNAYAHDGLGATSWSSAFTWCGALSDGAAGLSDGSAAGDWRLPNLRELQSLLDYGRSSPALPEAHPFTRVQHADYWTSTTSASNTSNAWTVSLSDGGASDSAAKAGNGYILPIRNCGDGADLCCTNQRVASNLCVDCPPYTTNKAGDDSTGGDTACDPVLCGVNERVSSKACVACASGTTNAAGDEQGGPDTACDPKFRLTSWALLGSNTPAAASAYIGHFDPNTRKFWLLGGDEGSGNYLTTATDYDLDTSSWSSFDLGASYTYFSAQGHTYASLSDTMVVFLYNDHLGIFDTSTEQIEHPWSVANSEIIGRDTYSAMATDGRYIFVTGGYWDDNGDDFWIYDTVNEVWIEGPTMNSRRAYHTAQVSPEGYLYVFGGLYTNTDVTRTIEKIDISDMDNINSKPWTVIGAAMSSDRYLHRSCLVEKADDTQVFIIGGYPPTGLVEIFDTKTETITTGPAMEAGRYRPTALATEDKIYVFGGRTEPASYSNTVEVSNAGYE